MTDVPPPVLVLASASPRRLALLRQVGIEPGMVVPGDIVEDPTPRELPPHHARRLAREKALAAAVPGRFTLGADTVVAVGRRILPKAEDQEQARACLALLSGRGHRVHTAVALVTPDGRLRERLVESRVRFKRLSVQETRAYLLAGEWRGKAGGYAIQGLAAAFVVGLVGSYSGVVGLPLYETLCLLEGEGFPVRRSWPTEPNPAGGYPA